MHCVPVVTVQPARLLTKGEREITAPGNSGRCTGPGVSCPTEPTPASSSSWRSPSEVVLGEGALTGAPGLTPGAAVLLKEA